jgi:hypothetical protein
MCRQLRNSSGLDSFQILQRRYSHDARFVGEKVQQSCVIFVDVVATGRGVQNIGRIRGTRMAFPLYEIVHGA